ncbi:helix-turn-helix transcriptional regulator [Paenibacillus lemnae]|uniref:AraC family transcriptional regulator n=1 Tax=Paenibacillus lemnae TaxID=1330551 RepID=A0A848M9D1_PAELE|nr:AraC family transcriptional regulator [Paenibacillus lemnae]NMO97216.1 AraC family transcriptional regulator [Paenibacillus lemnae]
MDQSLRLSLKEMQMHGDARFPFEIYEYHFPPGAHVVDSHWHPENEIFTVLEGEVLFQIDTEMIHVQAGESVMIDGGDIHTGHAKGSRGCRFRAMVFDPSLLASSGYDVIQEETVLPFQERKATIPRWISPVQHPELAAQIKAMMSAATERLPGYQAAIKGRLLVLLSQAAAANFLVNRSRSADHSRSRTERLKKVIAFIQSHYQQPIRLGELSALIPMSEGQFCRFFKSMTGQTPMDYINSYRVRVAAGMLQDHERKISDIAMDVGFGHISYFVRVFRRFMGCTPSQFRKKQGV